MSSAPGAPHGRGTVDMALTVESGDLEHVHLTATPEFDGVDVEVPSSGLIVEGLRGSVPVAVDLAVTGLADGAAGKIHVALVRGPRADSYARLRFADHQPFIKGSPYIVAHRVRVAMRDQRGALRPVELGRLAGNLHVDGTTLALDQLELEAGEGRVTGQCTVDLRGDDTTFDFRGAFTNFRTDGSAQRLDMNAAISLAPYRGLLEGRVELVRLGREHLAWLLDVWDPYHADVAANRARKALEVGYPKRVRLDMQDGFARLALDLGGVAGIVRLDEIRGLPVGPVLERYLPKRSAEESQ
jgi:hypothetical protein